MKHITLVLITCVIVGTVGAQAPDWQVTPADYEHSMTISGVVEIDAERISAENDLLAAWVGTELRGVAESIYIPATDQYHFLLIIYSDMAGEEVTFSFYDDSEDLMMPLANEEPFMIDDNQGTFSDPYIFFNLSDSLITHFDFLNIEETVEIDLNNQEIRIVVPDGTDLSGLIADYLFLYADSVQINGNTQESGVTSNDFNNEITYSVYTHGGVFDWKIVISTVLGSEDLSEHNRVAVYPNPAYGPVSVSSEFAIDEIHLINGAGIILQKSASKTIDLTDVPCDTYFLRIRQGDTWVVQKIVKY